MSNIDSNQTSIYPPKIVHFETISVLYDAAYLALEENILSTQGLKGSCRLLFCGGSTPLPLYKKIGISPVIDWVKLEIFQSDERFIHPTDTNSNQFQIRENLGLFATEEMERNGNLHFWQTENLEKSLSDYSEKLENLDGIWFDETILGIGSDGHIASLFPRGNFANKNTVISSQTADFAVAQRLSLSVESLLNSEKITVLLTGNKIDTLQEMLEGKLKAVDFPAKFLLAHPNLHILTCFD